VSQKINDNHTDEQLVKRTLEGDRQAYGLIVKNTEGLVAQIVFKMISIPADRKDLAQDVYLKAFSNLSGFRFQAKLSTWIGQIAYNSCLHYLEKKKLVLLEDFEVDDNVQEDSLRKISDSFTASLGNDTEKLLSEKELSAILKVEIEKLSPLYKTLITLYHNEELSYAEIAQITALPDGTVKNYLFRARKILKVNLLLNYKREDL
jgi:RNA polymerase sigma factor (sigma-70 family)